MYHGNLPSVKYAPSTDRRSENQMMMIKVRNADCQLFAWVRRIQLDFMEGESAWLTYLILYVERGPPTLASSRSQLVMVKRGTESMNSKKKDLKLEIDLVWGVNRSARVSRCPSPFISQGRVFKSTRASHIRLISYY